MKTAPGFGAAPAAVPITAESQPDLWLLVADTAARLGVPAPAEVDLYPVPEVVALPGRLLLGLPYVLDLPADELAAVVAHELVHLHSASRLVPAGGAGVEGLADALVAQVVSPESVAAALVHASYLSLTFERFVLQYVGPLAAAGWYPVDFWAAWRWRLGQERERFELPELAGRVTALLGTSRVPAGVAGVRPVPLRPLPVEVEAGFAKLLAERLGSAAPGPVTPGPVTPAPLAPAPCPTSVRFGGRARTEPEPAGLRAVTFDAADASVWEEAATQCAIRVREVAADILGHPAVLARDVLGLVLAGRAAEILRRCGGQSPELFPVSRILVPLISDALRRSGHRPEHVLRQHVLIGPDFERVDLDELIDPLERGAEPDQRLLDLLG
ncbi:M48 family metalloprotease [Actinocorallia populi]|uniref:hypothetical protein n=1 Tax=Actinocorallia populi TaxID=2079200 RepID=UPI0013003983|nr:hypothetical protein [Actinocorallia populi]